MPLNVSPITPLPALLLDFDGTACIGDGPVWAYAEAVIAAAPARFRSEVDLAVRTQLDAFLSGEVKKDFADGYAAVAAIGGRYVTTAELQAAYLGSREELAAGAIDISAPAGLPELLDTMAGRVHRMLVTNAPDRALSAVLDQIGLSGRFDQIITDANKPTGWESILQIVLADRPASSVLAIGDIWRNDIAAPLQAGCATGLVDRFGREDGPSHLVGSTLEQLYDGIRSWSADPDGFTARCRYAATS